MGEFKGTKGKWVISPSSEGFISDTADKFAIAKVFYNLEINTIESKANAKLIACAPEMLESIKELLPIAMEFINENHPTYKKVTELIKKATE